MDLISQLVILGAGGAGRTAASIARRCGIERISFYDDSELLIGTRVDGIPVVGSIQAAVEHGSTSVVVALGAFGIKRAYELVHLLDMSARLASPLIDPSASVMGTAEAGATVCAGAVVQTGARIGHGAFIGSNATIDHDSAVGAAGYVSPGAVITGGASVGHGAMIGASATVAPGVCVGDWATLGAGSVALSSVAEGETAVGVPARTLGRKDHARG